MTEQETALERRTVVASIAERARGAFNAAQWTAYQGLPAPVLFVCEDNGIGISVKTPGGWIGSGSPGVGRGLAC